MSDFEVLSNGVAILTLDRPPVNAFDDTLLEFLSASLHTLETTDNVGSLLVTSRGKHFSAGADMKYISAWGSDRKATENLVAFSGALQDAFLRIAQLPFPSVVALHGTSAGAGLEMALACDLRVIARDANLGLPEVRFGWIASAGGTQRLTQRVGRSAAMRIMLAEEFITGAEAYRLGLADWLVESNEDATSKARSVAEKLASHPRAAVRAIKELTRLEGPEGFAKELLFTRLLENEKESKGLVDKFLARKD
jgi:enoyl-CoA hydratase